MLVVGVLSLALTLAFGLTARWSQNGIGDARRDTSRSLDVACGGHTPPRARPKTNLHRPTQPIKRAFDYYAVLHTSCGDIRIDLLEDQAPISVANFVFLAKEDFYDGLEWHHVVFDFLIQTGDPNGQNGVAPDGPGYTIPDELPRRGPSYTYGSVGFALSGGKPDSAGSQFFIVVHDLTGALNGNADPLSIPRLYSVFGRVEPAFYGSLDTISRVKTIGGDDPIASARPQKSVYIEDVEIITTPEQPD